MVNKPSSTDEIKQTILAAAEKRYRQYGFNKTTMAEIAQDCDMSAANLYRHFENKLDIGAHLAKRCLAEEAEKLQAILGQSDLTAAQRLREFVLAILHHTHSQWAETPKVNEMVEAICHACMDIVDQHMLAKQAMLITLLKEGNRRGELDVADPEETAEAILTAITLFDLPMLMPMFSLQALERKANGLVSLILAGLLKR